MNEISKPHGVVLIDKLAGVTSHDVVASARRIFQTKSVGHAGTLDPDATGLLVLLLGEATKISDYILCGDKGYEVSAKLGIETDTADISGQVIKTSAVNVTGDRIKKAVLELQGELSLLPPMYSAIKVKGKKLYELARKNESIDLNPRPMKFYDITLDEIEGETIKLKMKCSKGSYVRSWVSELGKVLGCGATVLSLRRTWSEPFSVEQSCLLEKIEPKEHNLSGVSSFLPLSECVSQWKSLSANQEEEKTLRNGRLNSSLLAQLTPGHYVGNLKVVSGVSGKLISILTRGEDSQVRIRRVFNY